MIDEEGAIGLSEVMKTNTTIVTLDMNGGPQANEAERETI